MHSGRISQCYINIIRNTFIAKTSNAYTTKKKTVKPRIGPGQTWTIYECTEGRLLDHCATLPRISLSGQIISFNAFSCEILPVDAVWSCWSCTYRITSFVFVNIISWATQITVIIYFKILSVRLPPKMYVETYETLSRWMKFCFSYALV